jgi:hypothetical protein
VKDIHIQALNLLNRCTFLPGSFAKRFVRDLSGKEDKQGYELSEKQKRYLWKLVYQYRKQHTDKWFTVHAQNLIEKWKKEDE